MRRRRENPTLGLSFLDCICCGFGAIILLFVISMGAQNPTVKRTRDMLRNVIEQQLAEISELKSKQTEIIKKLGAEEKELIENKKKKEDIESQLADLKKKIQYHSAGKESLIAKIEKEQKEIAALQKKADVKQEKSPLPIGVPVESNYIAFVIDTSGSMRDPNTGYIWEAVLRKIGQVLESYPKVDGIQVLDADGRFIVGRSAAQWFPDSYEVRQGIIRSVARYGIFSESNPVPGIYRAIRSLHDPSNPKMKMGIYVFGDEFTGTADRVLRRIRALNPPDKNGKTPVTINAIGFPTVIGYGFSMRNTGLKFSNLMRELTYENGGAFMGMVW